MQYDGYIPPPRATNYHTFLSPFHLPDEDELELNREYYGKWSCHGTGPENPFEIHYRRICGQPR
ncbi:hypothetical protein AGR5A_Lc50169 [Agrobacterium genomosp. 5 str. CFBP 6626]|nr:hypothetical protein AGR5A_Lc50169 [Agrobacterium genomosp. 5 str. CFBP 6626]